MSKLCMFLILIILKSTISADVTRGVNLGGWLMLEPWITPSLFEQFRNTSFENTAIDETTFNQRLGYQEAFKQLEKHWTEWVTEEDFMKIRDYGLDAVRIPFSWWIIHTGTGLVSGLHHLDRGVQLAKKYGLKVLLDLHGAPLSQNGFDNSGLTCTNFYRSGKCPTNCPDKLGWGQDADNNFESLRLTLETLKKITLRYKDQDHIYGIQLVNEPWLTIDIDLLKNWYMEAYTELRSIAPKSWNIVMHDSFRQNQWQDFMLDKARYPNNIIDSHIYFAFSQDIMKMKPEEIVKASCNVVDQVKLLKKSGQTVIIGEWSLGHDDCAQWLVGFRQNPVKTEILKLSCDEAFSDSDYSNFVRNQLWAWEKADGWFFWNFKNELEDNWSYFKLVERGWVPKDARTFPEWVKGSMCNK